MKKIINCFLILSIVSMVSCTMEKRLYSSGYHINWKGGDDRAENTDAQDTLSPKNKQLAHVISKSAIASKKLITSSVKKQDKLVADKEVIGSKNGILTKNVLVQDEEGDVKLLKAKKINSIRKSLEKQFLSKKSKTIRTAPEPRRNEMHILTKIALLLVGIGLVFLIISFWAWYFTFLSDVSDETGVGSSYSLPYTFLITGLASLISGLVILILRWITA